MRMLPVIIIACAVVLAGLIFVFVPRMLADDGLPSGVDRDFISGASDTGGGAVDSGARIELELLRGELEALQDRVDGLEQEIRAIRQRQAEPLLNDQSAEVLNQGPNAIIDQYAQVVLIANRREINQGLTLPGSRYLIERLGMPREQLGDTCQAMTNQRLADQLVLEEVGPIRVRMLQPAVDSLRVVFENIRRADQDLYDRINTAGSLCVRRIRGSQNSVSTHSFGLAVDLNIDGHLDTLGDGKTQLGLTILADFFNDEGWFWGAAFGREDSMHFEISREKLDEWLDAGLI